MSIENSLGPSISTNILPSIGNEGLAFGAIAHYDDSSIIGSNPVTEWKNKAVGSAAFDLDTVVGTDANLITLESGIGLTTGTAGDYFSTPDSAEASPTTDLTMIAWIAPADWTPAADGTIIDKLAGAGLRSYQLTLTATTGTLKVFLSADGTALVGPKVSTESTGFTDGTGHWVRATFDDTADTLTFIS